MALEGTLRDFSLADIFQLIGIQRKTGVLTLKNEADVVTVSFLNGSVVSADSLKKNIEDRLGTVLVKSGRITAEQLQTALRRQKNTLQRLGAVVVSEGYISQEELREALQLQVLQIVYRLFRWRDGDYHFSQEESLNYDRENFVPIGAQVILMEGVRMIDEWPMIEKRIRSFDMIFVPTDPDREVLEDSGEEGHGDLELDAALGGGAGAAPPPPPAGDALRLPSEEARVYRMVDGRATVQELIDRMRLGEFETCRILHDLLERGLIREARAVLPAREKAPTKAESPAVGVLAHLGSAVVVALAVISLLTAAWNPLNLIPVPFNESPTVDSFKRVLSRNRLDQIDHGLYLYFLEHQDFPPALGDLVSGGFVSRAVTRDPWGHFYAYEIRGNGYRIVGYDNGGVEDPSLTRTRTFPSGLLPGDRPGS